MSDTIKPVAWRYEVRGNNADGFPTTEWREYGTYRTQAQAESHLAYCGNGIEGRVVPLVRAENALDRIERLSYDNAVLAARLDTVRKELAHERCISARLATEAEQLRDDRDNLTYAVQTWRVECERLRREILFMKGYPADSPQPSGTRDDH